MNIKDVQTNLQNLTNSKITLTSIAKALGKDLGNISAKAKRGTELKFDEVLKLEKYFGVSLMNHLTVPDMPRLDKPNLLTPFYKHVSTNDITKKEPLISDDMIVLEHVHLNPSCGNGTYAYEEAEITPIMLGKALIKDVFKISNPSDLKIFKASGDSMEKTIFDNDLLLVNTAINDYISSGIYILCKNNEFFCKRLNLLINGDLEIISDNERYRVEIVNHNSDIELKILGKVIKNLSRGL